MLPGRCPLGIIRVSGKENTIILEETSNDNLEKCSFTRLKGETGFLKGSRKTKSGERSAGSPASALESTYPECTGSKLTSEGCVWHSRFSV